METCKTCKFWINNINATTALCVKLSGEPVENGVMVIRIEEADDDLIEEEVYTGSGFGCRHHESK